MVIKQLMYVSALARERHFGRAAKACHVSQPTLSAAIRQLEDELGAPIVQRGQRFAGFTAEGECILEYANRILSECDALKQDLGRLRSGLIGRLRLGVMPTAQATVSLLTGPFHAQHPLVTIAVLAHSSTEILRGIENFEVDAGLIYLDIDSLGRMKTAPLYREEYLLLTPESGPFGDHDNVTWTAAADVPLCLLMPGIQNRVTIDGAFQSVGRQPKPTVETNSIFSLCSYVSAGHGSSIVPKALLQAIGMPEGTRAIPLVEPTVTRTVGLVIADREPPSPLAASLFKLAGTLDIQAALAAAAVPRPRPPRIPPRLVR